MEVKLDRARTNGDLCQTFPNAHLECLTTTSSYHFLFWIMCDPISTSMSSTRRFKFENALLAEPGFEDFESMLAYLKWS